MDEAQEHPIGQIVQDQQPAVAEEPNPLLVNEGEVAEYPSWVHEPAVCCVTGVDLSQERKEALYSLGVPKQFWTSVEIARRTVHRKRAAHVGEEGAFLIVDRVDLSSSVSASGADDDVTPDPHESIPPPVPVPAPVDDDAPPPPPPEED